jgi:hypothetical protein
MPITANHSTPESEWTRAIDAGLADWSRYIVGDAVLNITNQQFEEMQRLAVAFGPQVYVGEQDGERVWINQSAAALQGLAPTLYDSILINSSAPWSFGVEGEEGKHHAASVMTHELGHILYAFLGGSGTSPFKNWERENPDGAEGDGYHTSGGLMFPTLPPGTTIGVTDEDAKIAGKSGLPTIFDDVVYLIDGANVDGGAGNDRAVWLGSFDDYNADLLNFETLDMAGADPLSSGQQDIYKLYRAGLDRDPDFAGFKFWSDFGIDLPEIAGYFIGAPEFSHTASISDRGDYISSLYQNILGREPEQAGLDYWNGRDDLDRAGLLANIAVAPENQIEDTLFLL